MKHIRDLSYRVKMLLVFGISILLLTVIVTAALTMQSYRHMEENIHSYLDLTCEQALMNFESETSALARRFMDQLNARGIPDFLYGYAEGTSALTSQRSREIAEALSRTITANSGYDSVYIRALDGTSFTDTFAGQSFIETVNHLLETYGEKNYGRPQWVRGEDGRVYLVRDVYHLQPFRFVGKAVARLNDMDLIRLGAGELSRDAIVCFFYEERYVTGISGRNTLPEGIESVAAGDADQNHYMRSSSQQGRWSAAGLMSDSVLGAMNAGVVRAGLIIGLVAIVLGSLVVLVATRGMTKQISTLLNTMDEMAGGELNVRAPVNSGDEIGQLSEHFNAMAENNQTLMTRLVSEEKQKNQAEYDALEYRYRSLQSQINPHFIYNAMEAVNAMAKLSGQEDICEAVGHISSFFRQNTRNMSRRFITVQQEFDSLSEYACIFKTIYGDVLETFFDCAPEAEEALIPTMILQPLMENALVHGMRAQKSVVSICAGIPDENRLVITVEDNGAGMTEETLRHILLDEPLPEETGEKKPGTGVGVRNVRDRLTLIYGDEAGFDIKSAPGQGTVVTVGLPLNYEEKV